MMQVQPNNRPLLRRSWLAAMLAILCLPLALTAEESGVAPGLLRYVFNNWGEEGKSRVLGWRQMVHAQRTPTPSSPAALSEGENSLAAGNAFWNRIPFQSDRTHWGKDDYWSTPVEMLGSNGGDCEDYSIGKYFTLRESGTPVQQLRIVYVRAAGRNEPHMVLAYYAEPDADPLILDNLNGRILPASQRKDLDPVFSFNDEDLWTAAGTARFEKTGPIRRWREVRDKMAREALL